jgi:hypothetical protein
VLAQEHVSEGALAQWLQQAELGNAVAQIVGERLLPHAMSGSTKNEEEVKDV